MQRHHTLTALLTATLCAATFTAHAAPEGDYEVRNLGKAPTIDGRLDEWKTCPQIATKQPNVPDLRFELASLGWDSNTLYLAARVTDSAVVNALPLEGIQGADCVEWRVCAADSNRTVVYQMCLAPASAAGKPAFTMTRQEPATKKKTPLVATTESDAPSGIRWAVARDERAWAVEAAIPFAVLGTTPALGSRLPFVLVAWDRDRTDVDEWKEWHKRSESSSQKAPADQWPCAVLSGPNVFATRQAPPLEIERHRPCNLFQPNEDMSVQFRLKAFPAGKGEATAILTDAYGREVSRRPIPFAVTATGGEPFTANLGKPGRGYYELTLVARAEAADGQRTEATGKASLGVMEFANRSAAEARAKDYRFGLKWWGGVTDKPETLDMMGKLGLHWTRSQDRETPSLVTNFPLIAVTKIERFPKELYDEERYGKLEEWEKKYGRGAWTLKTLPRKEPYQKLLSETLAAIPPEQNVFEIWNEPWDKMSPEDFATLSQWIEKVVHRDRPNAILGQNLRGDMSEYGYDAKVAKAGGLKGMGMVCLHPYATSEDREWLRAYRKWISALAGRELAVYVTEYGSHSCPTGPARRTELDQARRVVRQSLALYAEDVKALIPHWVGQSERNPTYIEDWFGFIRKNQEPKPVLLAHANSARLIDGSRYLGDLWYGPGVGAMLFEKEGVRTLALWTLEATTNLVIDVDAQRGTVTDMLGAEKSQAAANGRLPLTVGPDIVYVSGLGAVAAEPASAELRADRWPVPAKPPRNSRTIHKLRTPPAMDGKLDDWKGATELALLNPKVNGDDASGMGYLAWDDQYLYLAVAMRDNEMLNTKPRAKLYQHDSIEVFVSTEPRDGNPGYGPNDRQYFLTPTSGEGKPIVGWLADREAGEVRDVEGAKHAFVKTGAGWVAEVAIPWSAVPPFTPGIGGRMAFDLRVNDADTSHERWKIDPIDGNPMPEDPTAWPLLILAD